jgi:hypothetical protein
VILATLAVAAVACTATTDISLFKDEIKKACVNAEANLIKSVSLTGNAEKVTLVMTYTFDWTGRRAAGTPQATLARDAAVISHDYFYERLPMKTFVLIMRDVKEQEMCRFVFKGEEKAPTTATCMTFVGTP